MADAILILDDGELADVARAFSNSEITFTRLRGAQISQGLAPPTHLLITTPRHAKAVRSLEGPKAYYLDMARARCNPVFAEVARVMEPHIRSILAAQEAGPARKVG